MRDAVRTQPYESQSVALAFFYMYFFFASNGGNVCAKGLEKCLP